MNGMLGHPAATGSPASPASSGSPPALGSPTAAGGGRDDHWHRTLDDYVQNDNSLQEPAKPRHEQIAKFCGHDIKFVFDWSTFKSSEWIGKDMGAGYVSDELTAGKNCVASLLPELARACEKDEARRSTLAKLKTVTCISKPDVEMYANHGYNHEYKVSDGGTNINSWICPRLMDDVDFPAGKFIETNF